MTTDEYVPSDQAVRASYRLYMERSGIEDADADFDRFLARVRRDAAREALDGYAAAEEDSFLNLHAKDSPHAAAQCAHAAVTAREYRDTHYPEETP